MKTPIQRMIDEEPSTAIVTETTIVSLRCAMRNEFPPAYDALIASELHFQEYSTLSRLATFSADTRLCHLASKLLVALTTRFESATTKRKP